MQEVIYIWVGGNILGYIVGAYDKQRSKTTGESALKQINNTELTLYF